MRKNKYELILDKYDFIKFKLPDFTIHYGMAGYPSGLLCIGKSLIPFFLIDHGCGYYVAEILDFSKSNIYRDDIQGILNNQILSKNSYILKKTQEIANVLKCSPGYVLNEYLTCCYGQFFKIMRLKESFIVINHLGTPKNLKILFFKWLCNLFEDEIEDNNSNIEEIIISIFDERILILLNLFKIFYEISKEIRELSVKTLFSHDQVKTISNVCHATISMKDDNLFHYRGVQVDYDINSWLYVGGFPRKKAYLIKVKDNLNPIAHGCPELKQIILEEQKYKMIETYLNHHKSIECYSILTHFITVYRDLC